MITYKAIIQYFDVMCERHQQINSFTYGELSLFDLEKFTKYPALHLTPTGTAIDDQTITYGFDVVIFDRYNTSTNKMVNEATCLSDALLILQDICKELTDGKYFINEDTNISMDMPIVATPFIDTQPDNCSGWTTSFEVITPNEASACNIPYYNPERQFHTDVILPPSAPSNNYVWYSTMEKQSKMGSSGETLTSLAPFIDKLSGSNTLQLNGSGVSFDRVENGFRFLDDLGFTDCYLEHPILANENGILFLKIKDFGRYSIQAQTQRILSFGNNDEIRLNTTSSGKLALFKFGSPPVETDFPVLPVDGTNASTQLKRIQPLTIAIQFTSSSIKLYYTNDSFAVATLNQTLNLTGEAFRIGSKGTGVYTEFVMQELFFTSESMTTQNIINTMNWLNYR